MKKLIKPTVVILLLIVSIFNTSCTKESTEGLVIDSELNTFEVESKSSCKTKEVLEIPFQSSSFSYVVQPCNKVVTIKGMIVEPLGLFPISVKYDFGYLKGKFVVKNRANERLSIKVVDQNEVVEFISLEPGYRAVLRKSKKGTLRVRIFKLK